MVGNGGYPKGIFKLKEEDCVREAPNKALLDTPFAIVKRKAPGSPCDPVEGSLDLLAQLLPKSPAQSLVIGNSLMQIPLGF